jgi:hypothetical protein
VISSSKIRLGLDIVGTFTNVALEVGERRFTATRVAGAAEPYAARITSEFARWLPI